MFTLILDPTLVTGLTLDGPLWAGLPALISVETEPAHGVPGLTIQWGCETEKIDNPHNSAGEVKVLFSGRYFVPGRAQGSD